MEYETIMAIATAIWIGFSSLVTAASLILKYIAPLTKNKIDDAIYEKVKKILAFISFAEETASKVNVKIKAKK